MMGPPVAPRLGFYGLGWMDYFRAAALSQMAGRIYLFEPSRELAEEASLIAPGISLVFSKEEFLAQGIEAAVIGTLDRCTAFEAQKLLRRGCAVFIQKIALDGTTEIKELIETARRSDALLALDRSLRSTEAMRLIRSAISANKIGALRSIELSVKNAGLPEQPWPLTPETNHHRSAWQLLEQLLDLAVWARDFPPLRQTTPPLPILSSSSARAGTLLLHNTPVHLRCRVNCGGDPLISARFIGWQGELTFRNINGSICDFIAERLRGGSRETWMAPLDPWTGRSLVDWLGTVRTRPQFDPEIETLALTCEAIYRIAGMDPR